MASSNVAKANDEIWDRFLKDGMPLLEDLEKDMGTRRSDYYDVAKKSADDLTMQRAAQDELRKGALGADISPEQATAQKQQMSLGRTVTESAGVNASVDVADSVNDKIAAGLMSTATGIETQALNNLSIAEGMASTRQQQGLANRQAASQQNVQGAGMALGLIAMMS